MSSWKAQGKHSCDTKVLYASCTKAGNLPPEFEFGSSPGHSLPPPLLGESDPGCYYPTKRKSLKNVFLVVSESLKTFSHTILSHSSQHVSDRIQLNLTDHTETVMY